MFKKIAAWLRIKKIGKQPLVLTDKQVEQSISNVFQKEVEAAERRDKTAGKYLSSGVGSDVDGRQHGVGRYI